MEFTKRFLFPPSSTTTTTATTLSSKSLDHFNFLLGCFIGVLGKRKDEAKVAAAAAGVEEMGERLQTRLGEWRVRAGVVVV